MYAAVLLCYNRTMDDLENLMKRFVGRFWKWTECNSEPYSPADKSQSEGDGERKLGWEFRSIGARKNPGGENAFPDLVVDRPGRLSPQPFGEVKAVSKKDQRINMGRHTEFSDRVREMVYDAVSQGKKVEFRLARKILGGHLGKEFLEKNLTAAQWSSLQRDFLKDYIEKAGGRVFLTSPEGWTCVDTSTWDQLQVSALAPAAVVVKPRKTVSPFA